MPPKRPSSKHPSATRKARSHASADLASIDLFPFDNDGKLICFWIDSFIPSHIVRDRTFFETYTPGRKEFKGPYGNIITVEGTGIVRIAVSVKGVTFNIVLRDCWHVPTSPRNNFSATSYTATGAQIMLSARSPRIIFSSKQRHVGPSIPKYLLLTQAKTSRCFAFAFRPAPIPISSSPASAPPSIIQPPILHPSSYIPCSMPVPAMTRSAAPTVVPPQDLSYQPFAGLSFNRFTLQSSSPRMSLSPPPPSVHSSRSHSSPNFSPTASSPLRQFPFTCPSGIVEAVGIHGDPNVNEEFTSHGSANVPLDTDVRVVLNGGVDDASHGGADAPVDMDACVGGVDAVGLGSLGPLC